MTRWLPAAGIQAAILVAMLLPAEAVPDGPDLLSIAFHVGAYAALAFALVHPGGLAKGTALALVLASAVGTESLQALAPGRSPDGWDVLADLVGASYGLGWGRRWRARRLSASRPGSDAAAGR